MLSNTCRRSFLLSVVLHHLFVVIFSRLSSFPPFLTHVFEGIIFDSYFDLSINGDDVGLDEPPIVDVAKNQDEERNQSTSQYTLLIEQRSHDDLSKDGEEFGDANEGDTGWEDLSFSPLEPLRENDHQANWGSDVGPQRTNERYLNLIDAHCPVVVGEVARLSASSNTVSILQQETFNTKST
jgi:hypothetical protein